MTFPIQRRIPHLGPNPDYSKAFYPDPPSHDFCTWLIIAELMRRKHNAPAPLKVRFGLVEGQLGVMDFGPCGILSGDAWPCGVSRTYHQTMLAHVLRPAIEMIGAVEEPAFENPWPHAELADYCEYDYHLRNVVDAGRMGCAIPQWQVPQWAHEEVGNFLYDDERPVVITLREAPAQPERNSRLDEWLKFAHAIKRDHSVLILRDTAKANEHIERLETWPRASTNVYVRAALYQRAWINMMVGNGPNVWCLFSDAPYLLFKQLIPDLPNWEMSGPIGWKKQVHLEVGDQYPWASPLQRMTWTDDTYENITTAFAEFLAVAQ